MTARPSGWLARVAIPCLVALAGCAGGQTGKFVASCAVTRLSDVPITMSGRLPLVPARIGTVDAAMVLDTGADWLLINQGGLDHLGLTPDRRRIGLSHGLNGVSVSYGVALPRLIIGSVDLGPRDGRVVPFRWPRAGPPPDGFLAGSILFIFDLDLDIPGHRLTLYMPRDCPGGRPPWQGAFATLDAQPMLAGHAQLAVHVTLDGHDLLATVDTGAEISVVSPRAASLLGLSEADLEGDRPITAQGFGPDAATARVHRFGEIAVAGEVVRGPMLAVADIPVGAGDMLLGEDWLRTHRVWVSYKSRRIYVAPAGSP